MSFQKRLKSGEFVVLAEMDTPKGVDISDLVLNARRVKGRVDAVTIPDMDNGVMRMSAIGAAVLMQQQGLEAVMHVYCRDRNRLALQGDLLAAYVLGIQNLIAVKGEVMANGDHRDAKTVDDLDELALIGAIRGLEQGVDMAGFALKGAPGFVTGCTLGACPDEKALDAELDLVRKKIDAGAGFVVTPPVYDLTHFDAFLKKAEGLGAPIIPTIFLIKSVGIARYISLNEPGAHLSEEIIKRIRKAPEREMECLRIAGETIAALKSRVQGVKIETVGWEYRLPAILDYAGL